MQEVITKLKAELDETYRKSGRLQEAIDGDEIKVSKTQDMWMRRQKQNMDRQAHILRMRIKDLEEAK
ncbi:putative prophage protein [Furfurilactobacillus rossiae]|uniref:crAss001_48 related protein n=1 Tax=Furfurilactobacillus rossiae TaxID=231049 RepID=UPI0015BC1786|nr:hypothetical protein [Furfurilactobacillus rossiae]QLE63998.1 putative prophage protein [Furfurilactobacillus rossiae]